MTNLQADIRHEAPESGQVEVAICTGGDSVTSRRIMRCPTCRRSRRFVCRFQVWYGTQATCLGCGDSWTDGEMHPRPFQRGWRKDAVERAKSDWTKALAHDEARSARRRLIREDISS